MVCYLPCGRVSLIILQMVQLWHSPRDPHSYTSFGILQHTYIRCIYWKVSSENIYQKQKSNRINRTNVYLIAPLWLIPGVKLWSISVTLLCHDTPPCWCYELRMCCCFSGMTECIYLHILILLPPVSAVDVIELEPLCVSVCEHSQPCCFEPWPWFLVW